MDDSNKKRDVKTVSISFSQWVFTQIETNKGKNRSKYIEEMVVKGMGLIPTPHIKKEDDTHETP